jgi:hypothetical protein
MNKVLYNLKTLVSSNPGRVRLKPISYTQKYEDVVPPKKVVIKGMDETETAPLLNEVLEKFMEPFQTGNMSTVNLNYDNGSYITQLQNLQPYLGTSACAEIAARSLAVIERSMYQQQEIATLKLNIQTLQDQLTAEARPRIAATIDTDLKADVSLDLRYLFYIQKYGPPVDGIFDPIKLAECVTT